MNAGQNKNEHLSQTQLLGCGASRPTPPENSRVVPNGPQDHYNRVLAVLQINGCDVAEILIGEGHAVVYYGRGPRMDWCK